VPPFFLAAPGGGEGVMVIWKGGIGWLHECMGISFVVMG
jgi:hypothetical protein